MIVTLTENSRIEWQPPRTWALARRANGFALAGVPWVRSRAGAFEPVDQFPSLGEAFAAALRLGMAMPGEPLSFAPMYEFLRRFDSNLSPTAELPALAHGYTLERRAGRIYLSVQSEGKPRPRFIGVSATVSRAVAQAVWEHAGPMRVTLKVGELGEFLAGIARDLARGAVLNERS
jgi:hypothetical protein